MRKQMVQTVKTSRSCTVQLNKTISGSEDRCWSCSSRSSITTWTTSFNLLLGRRPGLGYSQYLVTVVSVSYCWLCCCFWVKPHRRIRFDCFITVEQDIEKVQFSILQHKTQGAQTHNTQSEPVTSSSRLQFNSILWKLCNNKNYEWFPT